MKFALVISTAALLLCSCRTKPPVVRHFLRMPPECAAGLSSMERAQWLKEAKRSGTGYVEGGQFSLPKTVTKRGTAIRHLSVLHAPGQDSSAGGLAIVLTSGESASASAQLRLLEFKQSKYTDVTDRYSATRLPAVINWNLLTLEDIRYVRGSSFSGTRYQPEVEFYWNGSHWVQSSRPRL